MNITDAELFKEKLEDVLQAAEEFGSQAEQFDATKKDLNSFLSVAGSKSATCGCCH